jgi:hypothetical protein
MTPLIISLRQKVGRLSSSRRLMHLMAQLRQSWCLLRRRRDQTPGQRHLLKHSGSVMVLMRLQRRALLRRGLSQVTGPQLRWPSWVLSHSPRHLLRKSLCQKQRQRQGTDPLRSATHGQQRIRRVLTRHNRHQRHRTHLLLLHSLLMMTCSRVSSSRLNLQMGPGLRRLQMSRWQTLQP